ncbi:hypothetical protein Q31b_57380 [Novipirellula aureliae]|uniref:Uncharacterized protein n=1 Tax=Novipirellula aureliae TaxID=2527966 RepID=A0A5C6DCH9_9BACT|nr:hypothetical protein [Novipirellula aureliae]TWU33421.1 hypothetical protein Q31b_57380 [Novipirellula aureliae]
MCRTKVKPTRKELQERCRAAMAVHRRLHRTPKPAEPAAIDSTLLSRIERLRRLYRIADQRGWPSARRTIQQRLAQAYRALAFQAESFAIDLDTTSTCGPISSIHDIIADLNAMAVEYDTLRIERKTKTISVETQAIELEDTYLGAFEIRLELKRLTESCPYRIIARDPNPAQMCDGNTHPHVMDERLCEGEGQAAIKMALAQGRLYDFFAIVCQILQTYNADSAYISLDAWDGVECSECGDVISGDSRRQCDRCECELCNDCASSCSQCSETLCDDCSKSCSSCDETLCAYCLGECSACGDSFCENCLNSENLCDDCIEKQEAETSAEASTPEVTV